MPALCKLGPPLEFGLWGVVTSEALCSCKVTLVGKQDVTNDGSQSPGLAHACIMNIMTELRK